MAEKLLKLRPMSVSELLDTTFRLYRRHFLLFIGLVAVIQVPLVLFEFTFETAFVPTERLQAVSEETGNFWELYSDTGAYYSDMLLWMLGQIALVLLTFFAVQGLMNAAMTRAVYDRYLGRPLGLVDTYRALGWRWLRLVGALIVLGVLDLGLSFLFLIPCLGWIAAPILLIFINLPILSFVAPAVVVEDAGVFESLRRSFQLGRRKFWRVLGVNFLLWLLTLVISTPLPVLFGVGLAFWSPGFMLETVITSLLGLVVTVLVRPILVCGLTLLYFDLRMRLEGFDLELAAQEMLAEGTVSA